MIKITKPDSCPADVWALFDDKQRKWCMNDVAQMQDRQRLQESIRAIRDNRKGMACLISNQQSAPT